MDRNSIFYISNSNDFEKLALETFRFQAKNSSVYSEFIKHLKIDPNSIQNIAHIPFLPIQFFKSHKVLSSQKSNPQVFESSGTTGSIPSRHYITDLALYETSFLKGFQQFYGSPKDWVILALLPSYLERSGSSLVYMVDRLIRESDSLESGFYLDDLDNLRTKLALLDKTGKKILLIGVSFALLDLIQDTTFSLKNTTVMETGGMKGRRREMIKKELHSVLSNGFGLENIHSEYGMTELLSQAYSYGNGIFRCPPWMKVSVRDTEDSLSLVSHGKTGGINIIDLANVNSCSFIATQDLGKTYANGSFEVLGRFDTADIRGCNLMVL